MNLTMLTPIEPRHRRSTCAARATRTEVTWAMTGHDKLAHRQGHGTFSSIDRMVGGQFEKVLEDLKAIAEG